MKNVIAWLKRHFKPRFRGHFPSGAEIREVYRIVYRDGAEVNTVKEIKQANAKDISVRNRQRIGEIKNMLSQADTNSIKKEAFDQAIGLCGNCGDDVINLIAERLFEGMLLERF
jgi:hypothetical protein